MSKKSKNILYVLAHYDDELFCMNSIRKNLENGNKVYIFIMCGENDNLNRGEIFSNNMWKLKELYPDLKWNLHTYIQPFCPLITKNHNGDLWFLIENELVKIITGNNIEYVYTHSDDDMHSDHSFLSELVGVVCRKNRSNIKQLFEIRVPGSSEDFHANYFMEYNKEYFELLEIMFNSYSVALKYDNTFSSYEKLLAYNGMLSNYKYAEAYRLIYAKEDIS